MSLSALTSWLNLLRQWWRDHGRKMRMREGFWLILSSLLWLVILLAIRLAIAIP